MAARLKTIQINIPNPCHQNWEEMTPNGLDRVCNYCRKTVIDFTGYTDAQLSEFFKRNTDHICGRFLPAQLRREIIIPYQPNSRLYRIAITGGLLLMFTQLPQMYAAHRAPYSFIVSPGGDPDQNDTTKAHADRPIKHSVKNVKKAGLEYLKVPCVSPFRSSLKDIQESETRFVLPHKQIADAPTLGMLIIDRNSYKIPLGENSLDGDDLKHMGY